jgi:RimJ/RimL family protein N-acetyltransferase
VIRGEQSNLRAVERTDARFVCDLLNEPSVATGWGTSEVPLSIHRIESDIEQWIASELERGFPTALIIETVERAPVGLLLVLTSDRPNQSLATLSIAICSTERSKGLGADALAAVLDALFDEWGIHRVEVRCEAGNQPAIALYQKAGFVREAVRHRATFTGGEWGDQIVFGMIATDPRTIAL